jgi:hypothetical protein
LKRTVTITVTPPESVNDLEVSLEGNSANADLEEVSRDESTGVLTVTIAGRKETENPSPLKLKAVLETTEAEVEVRVVIPVTNVVEIGAPAATNALYNPNQEFNYAGKRLSSATALIVTNIASTFKYTFKDQYGDILGSIYDGTNIVEEDIKTTGGTVVIPGKVGPIVLPSGKLTNGVIEDDHQFFCAESVSVAAWSPTNVALYAAFKEITLPVAGGTSLKGNNVGQLFSKAYTWEHTQSLKVYGHEVTPVRTFQFKIDGKAIDPANLPNDTVIQK